MHNLTLNPRFAALGGYPFARLRALLDDLPAPQGLAVVDMSIGEPRRAFPPLVGEVLALRQAGFGRYPPARGSAELRGAVAAWLTRRYQLPAEMIDPDRHVLALSGTREGLFQTALVAVPPRKAGQQPAVLIPNPFYQCYAGAAAAAGAEPIFLPATMASGELPDLDALPSELLDRTALFFLCSPANPQGAAADLAYWTRLLALARRHGFLVAADECYAEIYRDLAPTGALEAAARSGSLDNLLVFHSLSKRSSVPGLRAGFCAGDAAVLELFATVRSYGGSPLPPPVDAVAAALWAEEAHVTATRAHYNAAYDIAARLLGGRFGNDPRALRPDAGFFLWLNVGDGEAMTRRLWAEGGLRVLPGAYLTRPGADGSNIGAPYIRLALVDDLTAIESGLQRLSKALAKALDGALDGVGDGAARSAPGPAEAAAG